MKIRYPNKVIAHIHVSWLDHNKIRKMTIVGSRKMIVYDDISQEIKEVRKEINNKK